jgi:hypothetical protein
MGKIVNEFGYVYKITKVFNEKDWIILEEDFFTPYIYSSDMYSKWNRYDKTNYTLPKGMAIRCEKIMEMCRSGSVYSGADTFDEIDFKPLKKYNKDSKCELISSKFRLKMSDMVGMKYSVHTIEGLVRKRKIDKVLE